VKRAVDSAWRTFQRNEVVTHSTSDDEVEEASKGVSDWDPTNNARLEQAAGSSEELERSGSLPQKQEQTILSSSSKTKTM
jgi:hypothetical protein